MTSSFTLRILNCARTGVGNLGTSMMMAEAHVRPAKSRLLMGRGRRERYGTASGAATEERSDPVAREHLYDGA